MTALPKSKTVVSDSKETTLSKDSVKQVQQVGDTTKRVIITKDSIQLIDSINQVQQVSDTTKPAIITKDSIQAEVVIDSPPKRMGVIDSLIARQKFVRDSTFAAQKAARLAYKQEQIKNSIARKVNPFIGTGGHGHTFPGATTPFGMVQLSPDTRLSGWDGCSGYHFSDDSVYGFSHTHLSGTGVSDYGDILLMPGTGKHYLNNGADGKAGYRSHFDKKREKAFAGYYETYLTDYRTLVRLTSGWRTGFHQYVFPKNSKKWVVLDLNHRDKVIECRLEVEDAYTVSGYRRSSGWAEDQVVYYYIKFSEPITRQETKIERVEDDHLKAGAAKSAVAVFFFDDLLSDSLMVKVGISSTSVKAAKFNMLFDGDHWNFNKRKEATEKLWNRELKKILIETPDKDEETTFYTALYHTMMAPNIFSDIEGSYRGLDKVRHQAKGYKHYTVFSLWDTYRATHPLYTIIDPQRTRDFLNTFAHQIY